MGHGSRWVTQSVRFFVSTGLVLFFMVALTGCGNGSSGSGTGSTGGSGGSGGGSAFQPRPFPGDYFVTPPATEYGSAFPGNVVYDSALQEFFFSNQGMNEVEAYSTVAGHHVGAVTVPGPMGLSLSPDGSQLAVGTATPYIYFVNPAALHLTGQVEVPASVLSPASGLEPVLPFLMATGPMLIEAADPNSIVAGEGNLLSYDPASGAFAVMNPPDAYIGVYGAAPARSLDGNYLAVPTLGQTALEMDVYSAATHSYIGSTPGQYGIRTVAASPDGSQFVTVGTPSYNGGGSYITFWSRSLEQQEQYAPNPNDLNIVYSRDGSYLYVNEASDVLALNTQTGLPAGYQGLSIASLQAPNLYDTDENNRVYGLTGTGAFVVSVAQLQPAAPTMPEFEEDILGESIGNPNEGPLSGGTAVQFFPTSIGTGSADGISSSMEAYFGSVPATNDAVATYSGSSDGGNAITATAPPASTNGPVTVLLTDADNNAVLLPEAYSYGPHAHWVDPSAVGSEGGLSTLWADGILSLQGRGGTIPNVTIGGAAAPASPLSVVGGDTWREVQLQVPAGKPGWANLKMSLPDGTSETTKNMVQYLAQDASLTAAAYTAAVYDASRDRFYLTGADNTVAVFDPGSQSLLRPITSSKISSTAVLGSLAITPDDFALLVSDPKDHSLVVFNLTSGASTAVNVLVPSDGALTITAPMPVVALSGTRALVILTPSQANEVREIDLAQRTVQVRTDVQNAAPFSISPSTMAASADGSVALLGGETPGSPTTYYAWEYAALSDSFTAPLTLPYYPQGDGVAVNGNGTVLGLGAFTLDVKLLPLVPFQFAGFSQLLTATGALRYSNSDSGEVQISDTRNGRGLLTISGPQTPSPGAFAVSPDGREILVVGGTTLDYYELAVVPLAVASVSPAQAAPGASVTVLGNGFVAGTTATIAGQSTSCSMVNDQTLQCVVPSVNAGLAPMTLSNPDGQTYSFEAAVTVE